ncbi:hypothetical protein Q0S99_18005, partial [Stenotrophomonas indicatrix]|uniref:hypothetical protein n=1 Tax=Stenotrophomonas indicatrix TaxID=2045451 RepID=UPI00264DF6E4
TRPWGLGRGIHAADTPATGPTPPSTGLRNLSERRSVRLLVGVDLGRHGRSTPCVDGRCHEWLKDRFLILFLILILS